jgi:signal transduction histidine kinase
MALATSRSRYCFAVTLLALIASLTTLPIEAAEPKRVLIIHSYGREIAPYDAIASTFRTELARGSTEPIAIYEASIDAGRPGASEDDEPLIEFLLHRFAGLTPDVVVTIGAPAGRFYARHRTQLFPSTPLVMAALDERIARTVTLGPNDRAVAGRVDLPRLIDNILQVVPDTKTVAVVVGKSALEGFWLNEMQREFVPFRNRVNFIWLNESSLEQMRERVANLPPHSAVFYALLIVDAAGIPRERQDALASLYAASNAPIFGLYESELGKGVVGGPYSSQRRRGEMTAAAALRALRGGTRAEPALEVTGFEPPVYDWRELTRWGIDESRLPPGSTIRFRPPSLWDEHKTAIIAIAATLFLQALLITALAFQGIRRRTAEREAQSLGGQLLTAHEDERRRLARDLHDDVTQRLASLSIDTAHLERIVGTPEAGYAARSVRDGLKRLGEDVHALSYRLHPSVLEDLGLVEALKVECDSVARLESIRSNLDARVVPQKLPNDAALCLFRVAQEALRNVVRHAKASAVEISLSSRDDGLQLTVVDDGVGFDPARDKDRPSLGLASMRERVRQLGGRLDIESTPEGGTKILAWVPVRLAA